MTLRPPGTWVWDSWFVVHRDQVHAFYLHAPTSLGDPALRHQAARIGHAVSDDLLTWDVRRVALDPGPPGSFDDLATWTGSVIRDGDGWLMAYSGISVADHGRVQRIGFARSRDLDTWTRCGPVVEADPRWYECAPAWPETSWRDPWAWRAPDGTIHLLVTARADRGPGDGRGVIGHAWSSDGDIYTVGPPLSAPGEFDQLEVPQLVELAPDRWIVLASCRAADHSKVRRSRPGSIAETGTLVLEGDAPLGPFAASPGPFLLGDPADRAYAGRLVEFGGRRWLLAWTDRADGAFVGELADPLPVEVGPDGRLRVVATA